MSDKTATKKNVKSTHIPTSDPTLNPTSDPTSENAKLTDQDKRNAALYELLHSEVTDQNAALNIMIAYLGLAQQRGCYAFDESAKIYECINMFKT